MSSGATSLSKIDFLSQIGPHILHINMFCDADHT